MLRLVLVAMLALALTAPSAPATGTIYGCANSHGRVRLITTSPPTCRATETPISWNQQGPKGDKGDPGVQGPPGPVGPGLVMRDANGARVGVVFETDRDPAFANVVRSINGAPVKFQTISTINNWGGWPYPIFPGSKVRVYFESSDCSGTPLMPKPPAIVPLPVVRPFFFGEAAGDDRTLGYYQTGSIASHSVHSSLGFANDPAYCGAGNTFTPPYFCCTPEPGQVSDFAEAAPFDLATLGLVPPFHVEGP